LVIIGWDVSTTAIGICVKWEDRPHEFHVIFPKGETALDKWKDAQLNVLHFMDEISEKVDDELSKRPGAAGHGPYPYIKHVVEQRLGGFTGGLTTKQTLMALAAMNAVVSTELSGTGEIEFILPQTAKALTGLKKKQLEGEDKKETVVRLARFACPGFPYKEKKVSGKAKRGKGKTYPWVKGIDDMADAWLLVEAYQALKGKADGQSKKAAGRKGKARRAQADGSEEE
jgi:hypothetical protein